MQALKDICPPQTFENGNTLTPPLKSCNTMGGSINIMLHTQGTAETFLQEVSLTWAHTGNPVSTRAHTVL